MEIIKLAWDGRKTKAIELLKWKYIPRLPPKYLEYC